MVYTSNFKISPIQTVYNSNDGAYSSHGIYLHKTLGYIITYTIAMCTGFNGFVVVVHYNHRIFPTFVRSRTNNTVNTGHFIIT